MAWQLAVEVFGLPYMVANAGQPTQKEALAEALQALRGGRWAVIGKEDVIQTLDLAAAAGGGGAMFEKLVQVDRENIFQGVRGNSLPFQEGKGTAGAHGNTETGKDVSETPEKHDVLQLASVIQNQLFPFIVYSTFGENPDLVPTLWLGGTNYEDIESKINVFALYKEKLDGEPSKEHVQEELGIPEPRDDKDRLGTDQADAVELKGKVEGLQAVMDLSKAVAAGELQQSVAVELLVNLFGYEPMQALRFVPTDLPVNRVVAAEQKANPQPQPGAMGGALGVPALPGPQGKPPEPSPALASPEPTTFSDSHRPAWEADADAMIAELVGSG